RKKEAQVSSNAPAQSQTGNPSRVSLPNNWGNSNCCIGFLRFVGKSRPLDKKTFAEVPDAQEHDSVPGFINLVKNSGRFTQRKNPRYHGTFMPSVISYQCAAQRGKHSPPTTRNKTLLFI